ncbi:MAG: hypothetical protein ACOYB8_06790 [Eubacteriaceae bacterium]|jgi:hypothetical protein
MKKDTEDALDTAKLRALEYNDSVKQQFQEFTDNIAEDMNQYKMQIENK